MISVTEQGGAIPGLTYRANAVYSDSRNTALYYRTAVSYVTGAHAFKVGFNNGHGGNGPSLTYALQPVSYRFNNGVPNQITLNATPYATTTDVDSELGVYAQDRWTLKRLTLTLGVRYDHFADSFPEQSVGPALLAPNRNITFPAQKNVSLARHHAEVRRRLRSLRQRYDGGEGDAEQVPAGDVERRRGVAESCQHARQQHRESVDRREPELRAGLRSDQPGGAGQPRRRRRFLRRRWPTRISARRCRARPSIPARCAAGASATTTGNFPRACSRRSRPAPRWTSATSGGGTATSRSPTT